MIQLPSITMAACPLPKASPPHPEPSLDEKSATPSTIIFLTNVNASTFSGLLAVAVVPSGLTRAPPFWARNTPTRWISGPIARPTRLPSVSFVATDSSWSHVVGTSASVSPASSHIFVLITRASVEKSFGAQ